MQHNMLANKEEDYRNVLHSLEKMILQQTF